jgi:hypothetical protein
MMATHLELYQILDRFELLYPDNKNLADLRRAYIDKDLSSIFRLLEQYGRVKPDVDVSLIRSVTMEQNLYDIFRLVEYDDLRKIILEDNYWSLWKTLEQFQETEFVAAFKSFYANETNFDVDCFSRGQLESKKWLVERVKLLDIDLGTVFLCAGWYGTLATMLFESGISIDKVRSFDIDESCAKIAETFNKLWMVHDWKFKSITHDIHDIDFNGHSWQVWSKTNNRFSYPITDIPDTIINTSCEHITNFDEWYAKIPSGKLLILQSNDYMEVKEHTNCSIDADAFRKQTPMTNELFHGQILLPKYRRFMRIGYK